MLGKSNALSIHNQLKFYLHRDKSQTKTFQSVLYNQRKKARTGKTPLWKETEQIQTLQDCHLPITESVDNSQWLFWDAITKAIFKFRTQCRHMSKKI